MQFRVLPSICRCHFARSRLATCRGAKADDEGNCESTFFYYISHIWSLNYHLAYPETTTNETDMYSKFPKLLATLLIGPFLILGLGSPAPVTSSDVAAYSPAESERTASSSRSGGRMPDITIIGPRSIEPRTPTTYSADIIGSTAEDPESYYTFDWEKEPPRLPYTEVVNHFCTTTGYDGDTFTLSVEAKHKETGETISSKTIEVLVSTDGQDSRCVGPPHPCPCPKTS